MPIVGENLMKKFARNLPDSLPPLMYSFIEKALDSPKRIFSQSPSLADFNQFSKAVIKVLKKEKNFIRLSNRFKDVAIVGDTHGDLISTVKIVKAFLQKKTGSLVFLGDYVDRGENSFLNISRSTC